LRQQPLLTHHAAVALLVVQQHPNLALHAVQQPKHCCRAALSCMSVHM
jgi:hypothetical protein